MSKFIPLQFLGSEKEISKITNATISTLEREHKIRINQEVVVPAMVNCFIDAAIYESLQMLGDDKVRCELNLFEMFRIIHEIIPGEEIKMGSTIKVYITKVENGTKGPLILLSRNNYGAEEYYVDNDACCYYDYCR